MNVEEYLYENHVQDEDDMAFVYAEWELELADCKANLYMEIPPELEAFKAGFCQMLHDEHLGDGLNEFFGIPMTKFLDDPKTFYAITDWFGYSEAFYFLVDELRGFDCEALKNLWSF